MSTTTTIVRRPFEDLRERSLNALRGIMTVEFGFMALITAITLVMVVYPIAILFWNAFIDQATGALSLGNFSRMLDDPVLLKAVSSTFLFAAGGTAVSTVVGVLLAWITARTDSYGKQLFETLNVVPLFLSSFVGALSWRILLAPNVGLVNRLLRENLGFQTDIFNVYSIPGMVLVSVFFYVPYIYMFTIGSLRNMDPALEEAARVSGAGVLRTALTVTLPLNVPAILAGSLFIFVHAFGVLEIPLALGAPGHVYTLSTQIYYALEHYPRETNLAAAIAAIILLITMTGVYLQRRVVLSRSYATVTGKGYRPYVMKLGQWRRATLAFNCLYVFLAVLLPIPVLLMASLQRYWQGRFDFSALTLHNYQYALFEFETTQNAVRNSLITSSLGATAAVLIGLVISYIVYRTRFTGRAILDFVAMLPAAVPGVAMGMALLVAWISTPIYGTLSIIILAYTTRWLPVAQKSIAGALLSLGPELEESARVSGASWLKMMKDIVFPLLKPGILGAWMMLFVVFIRELSASVLLYKNGTEVMSVAMWQLLQVDIAMASAFMVFQVVLLLACVVVMQKLTGQSATARF